MESVLIYAMSENIGGVEEYVLNLSRYNSNQDCQYEYIILGERTPYQAEMDKLHVKYYFVPKKKHLLKNICTLYKLLKMRRQECSILYFNTSALVYPVPYILAYFFKYRIVLHSHSTETNGIRKVIHVINRTLINRITTERLACSTPAGEWMFGKKHLNQVHIVPNAIQLSRFSFSDEIRQNIREELGISNDFVIGHVGRLSSVKNQRFLIDILAEAVKHNNRTKLLLVGDGEDLEQLKEYAELMHVNEDVIFYGRTNTPEKLMCAMDCFVMPSLVEGFPITLVEAQASGLPCLVSENITREVNITGHVKFRSLEDNVELWCKDIFSLSDRYNAMDVLTSRGYDVNNLEQKVRRFLLDDM